MTTQIEKVVVSSDLCTTKYEGIESCYNFLYRRPQLSFTVRFSLLPLLGHGQRLAVHFAIRSKGQGIQEHNESWDHVRWQMFLQIAAQYRGCRGGWGLSPSGARLRPYHHIGHQALLSRGIFVSQHDRLTDGIMPHQGGFDLTQFDTESPQFHLMVNTTQIFNGSISPIACHISRTVETCPHWDRACPCPYGGHGEWIGDKAFCGQVRAILVAACYSQTSNTEFSSDPNRYQVPIGIQKSELGVGNGSANRNHSASFVMHSHLI